MRKVTLHPSLLLKKKGGSGVQISEIKKSEEKPSVNSPVNGGITITSIDGRFSILRPKSSNPLECQSILTRNPEDALSFLRSVKLEDSEDLVTFDTETTGTQIFGNKDFRIVTIGFGHGMRAISLDVRDLSKEELSEFLRSLKSLVAELNIPLAAHNLFFDASTIAYYLGGVKGNSSGAPGWMNYKYCTYALFRYLSSEGFVGQSHSLKFAMKELMLWRETNEVEQHEWMINNGYVKGPRGIHNPDNKTPPEERLKILREKIAEGKQYKPDKGQMYRVPHEILGKYNALDCFATYRFYRDILLPAMRKYTIHRFSWWHSEIMIMAIRNAVDNYQDGIYIDHKILDEYAIYMQKRLKKKIFTQFARGKYREAYLKISEAKYKLYRETKCPKTTHKEVCVKLGKEPIKYTKAGYLATSWIKWEMKRRRAEKQKGTTTPTKAYLKFRARCKQLRFFIKQGLISSNFTDKHWAYKFLLNPGSVADKVPFLFHEIEYTVVPSKYEGRAGRLRLKNGIEVDMSDSGAMPTGKSAITAIGGKKHILNLYNREIKKLQFVENAQRKVRGSDDGLLHIGYKVPGTNTQRLAGDGGLNLQNLIKDSAFLRAWQCKSKETHLLCQCDMAAVEPHVFTEFSRDAAMWKLYGPGAKPNDVYLFTGASMGGILGQPFLDLGYDPLNPTKEAMKACKEKYKNLRNVAKSLCLCIAKDTLIQVRGKGLIPIQDITEKDQVWDGEYWVNTSGALQQGKKRVMNMEGVILTPEHKLLTIQGWEKADDCKHRTEGELIRPKTANLRWTDVWAMGSYVIRNKIRKWVSLFKC